MVRSKYFEHRNWDSEEQHSKNILFRKAIEDLQKSLLSNTHYIEALQLQLAIVPSQEHNCNICGHTARSKTVLKSHKTRKQDKEVLRDETLEHSISSTNNLGGEVISDCDIDNQTMSIHQKVILNTLSSRKITCEECGEYFQMNRNCMMNISGLTTGPVLVKSNTKVLNPILTTRGI